MFESPSPDLPEEGGVTPKPLAIQSGGASELTSNANASGATCSTFEAFVVSLLEGSKSDAPTQAGLTPPCGPCLAEPCCSTLAAQPIVLLLGCTVRAPPNAVSVP
jgi:hypothetical protein